MTGPAQSRHESVGAGVEPCGHEKPSNLSDASDPLSNWGAYAGAVRSRLDAGRIAYGDRSFADHPAALLTELEQEALDLAGWGFILWSRLCAMRAALATEDE